MFNHSIPELCNQNIKKQNKRHQFCAVTGLSSILIWSFFLVHSKNSYHLEFVFNLWLCHTVFFFLLFKTARIKKIKKSKRFCLIFKFRNFGFNFQTEIRWFNVFKIYKGINHPFFFFREMEFKLHKTTKWSFESMFNCYLRMSFCCCLIWCAANKFNHANMFVNGFSI